MIDEFSNYANSVKNRNSSHSTSTREIEAVGTSVRCSLLCVTTQFRSQIHCIESLVQARRLAHRRLEVQRFDVLPVLFQERNEEVDAWANE